MIGGLSRLAGVTRRVGMRTTRTMADEAAASNKLTLNFLLPRMAIKKEASVDMVIVPSATGSMGVLPGHVPTVAQLKPGVLQIHEGDAVERYFVSSGFAFVHGTKTDVCAVEAAKVEDLDADAVRTGLSASEQELASAKDDLSKAEAQIGIDVYSAMQAALDGK